MTGCHAKSDISKVDSFTTNKTQKMALIPPLKNFLQISFFFNFHYETLLSVQNH